MTGLLIFQSCLGQVGFLSAVRTQAIKIALLTISVALGLSYPENIIE